MIFKEDDVMDIAIDKKATQSSIHSNSCINDASRACKQNLHIEDYAFHTALEDNPWWKLDLGDEVLIDCIRITNRNNKKFQERLKSIKVELSLDDKTYHCIDLSCFEWQNGLEILDINVYQTMPVRYIKISLQECNYLHFKKCQVFIRKIKGLIIAGLQGGYGDRLIAFLNALYIAKHSELKFAFIWQARIDNNNALKKIKNITLGNEKEVFDEIYIKEYSYTLTRGIKANNYHEFTSKQNTSDYICETSNYPYGYYIQHGFLKHYIKNAPQDYAKEFKDLFFNQIKFSKKINNVFQQSEIIFNENFSLIKNDLVAIHIRSGDAVYSSRRAYYSVAVSGVKEWTKATPVEVALYLININKQHEIILFGEDEESIKNLIQYFKNNLNKKIYYSKDYIPKHFDDIEIDFFEILFLSFCKEIYSFSGFARLASLIGNAKEPYNWADFLSLEQKYEIFHSNINKIQTDNYQKASSYLCFYYTAKLLNKGDEELIQILQNAYHYDDGYNITIQTFLIYHLMIMRRYAQAENIVKNLQHEHMFFDMFLNRMSKFYKKINIALENVAQGFELYRFPNLCYIFCRYFYDKKEIELSKKYFEAINKNRLSKERLERLEMMCFKSNNLFKNIQKENSAKERIKNHLAYKLGQAVIENSKSLKGYIRMPYVLSYIKDKHKQEQKAYEKAYKENPSLKLPPLETYSDYTEALKIKEYLSYKLGEALMKASNNAWGGGVCQICI